MMRAQKLVRGGLRTFPMNTLTGAVFCTWLALTVTLLGQYISDPVRLLVPFPPAAALIARVWGVAAAIVGITSSVAVFCAALFAPIGSIKVASPDAQTGLFWMVLGSVVAAYIFARPHRTHGKIRIGGKSC